MIVVKIVWFQTSESMRGELEKKLGRTKEEKYEIVMRE